MPPFQDTGRVPSSTLRVLHRPDISTVLDRTHTVSEAILHIGTADLDAVLATDQRDTYRREDRLKLALAPVAADYDYTISGRPPSLSLLTATAFTAASDVLIPTASDYCTLRGVERLLATIDGIWAEINPELAVLGMLPTRVGRTTNARAAIASTHQLFDHVISVFDLRFL